MYIRLLSAFLFVPFHRKTSQECAVVCKTVSKAYLLLIMLLCPAAGHAARGGGELSGRWGVLGLAGRGEGLRRSHDETAGAKPGASPVDRTTVNVGTIDTPLPRG